MLAAYTGTIVHDGYAPYDIYDDATHAQCGAHLLRHLDDVGQAGAFRTWTAQMAKVLTDAKAASEAAAADGKTRVDADVASRIRSRYGDTLDIAFALLPSGPPPRLRHRGGWSMASAKHGTWPPAWPTKV